MEDADKRRDLKQKGEDQSVQRDCTAPLGAALLHAVKYSKLQTAVPLLKECLQKPELKLTIRKQILRALITYPTQQVTCKCISKSHMRSNTRKAE